MLPTRKVVIRVIVPDVLHVHVFISRALTMHRVATIVIRIRRKVVSVPRVLVLVCRTMPLSVAAIVPVTTIIIRRVAIVPVLSMDSRVAIVPVTTSRPKVRKAAISSVLSMVSRVAIVLVTTTIIRRVATTSVRVVTSSVLVATISVRAVTSSAVVTTSVRAVSSSAVATISAVVISSVPVAIVSTLLAMIPMLSTA